MTDAMVKWHKSDLENRMYLNLEDGRKIAMPRYYKDKIYSDVERAKIAMKAKNDAFERNQLFEQEMLQKYGDDWYRMKAEADFYSFKRMYKNAKQDRNAV